MLTWPQKTIAAVIVLLLLVALSVVGIAVFRLRQAAIDDNLDRLQTIAHSWRISLENLDERKLPFMLEGSVQDQRKKLGEFIDQHYGELTRFGTTGEIRIGYREGDSIQFVYQGRSDWDITKSSVAWDSKSAEPMRRSLRGDDGSLIGLDYRGIEVLAAHAPVPKFFLGVVVKIDKSEVEAPYYEALVNTLIWLMVVVLVAGIYMVLRVYPILKAVDKQTDELSEANKLINVQVKDLEKAQQGVQRHSAFLETLIDTIPSPIFYKDLDGKYQQCNKEFAEGILGLSREEVIGRTVFELNNEIPADLAIAYHLKDQELIATQGTQDYEERVFTAAGQFRTYLFHKACVFDKSAKVQGLIGAMLDITERKRSEEALRERQRLLDNIMSTVPYGVYWKSKSMLYLGCNEVFAGIVGLSSPHQIVGRDDFDLNWGTCDAQWHRELDLKVVSEGEPILNFDHVHQGGPGKKKNYLLSVVPLKSADGTISGVLGITADITDIKIVEDEKRSLEQQLVQSQRLEAIGQLAAGVAHEINTPTQFVGDNLQFLKGAVEDLSTLIGKYGDLAQAAKSGDGVGRALGEVATCSNDIDCGYLLEEAPRAITEAIGGIERVATIVRSMKEFSHPDSNNRKMVDINAALDTTITVARNEWKYVANVEKEFDSTLPLVPCFLGELNQAVLNMIVNAAHAISDALQSRDEQMGLIRISTKSNEEWVEIIITDNGTGMPKEVQDKIFNPFFTTKGIGKGTGQGLAIAYNAVVKKHGGTLTVDSTPGKGTAFTIRLPLKVSPLC